ncbi:phage tail protein [Flavobacterium sp. MK4S-17]|jgi:microcystin-dependent protein|uniref:phage tail protein n=1 Tax=Flavobacterium sp. MK4S-17 TaxID=2543737 RepID=UPI00135767A5|nr:tail fiber protein [Flavobacterium sp. MK4S-17]
MEGTIGEIRLFAASFAPKSWWYCDGSIIAIRSNTALYSILGTTYGGDGVQTFALPDLRGRTAIGAGQGPGLSYYSLGESIGVNTVTLTSVNLPPHTHAASVNVTIPTYSDEGTTGSPTGNVLASKPQMYTTEETDTHLKPIPYNASIGIAGSSMPFNIMQPVIGMNYIICMYGVFPARQ